MKKLIFFSLALLSLASCRREELPCPHGITCRIYEKDSNNPIPFGVVGFYTEPNFFSGPGDLVQAYTADANGYFTVSSDLKWDYGIAVATEPWHYSDFALDNVLFSNNAETMNFYIACVSEVKVSVVDDPNTNSNVPINVMFSSTNPIFPPLTQTSIAPGQAGDSLQVKSYLPSQIIATAYFNGGVTTNDTIDIPALQPGASFIYNYAY